MERIFRYGLITALCVTPILAKKMTFPSSDNKVQIVAVTPSPEPNDVDLKIVLPEENEVVTEKPIWVQLRIEGFSLGTETQMLRNEEIATSRLGQSAHIVIDNKPYFAKAEPQIEPFDRDAVYFQDQYKFSIPFDLSDGIHTIRAFLCRSYGESLKGKNCFQASTFYYNKKKDSKNRLKLQQPYLTYNEPTNNFRHKENQPVLLDFYVSNCEISPDGYKVQLTIDGKYQRVLTEWVPHYIYGLKKGVHKVVLELLDMHNNLVSGESTSVEGTFSVY
ncbi:MAG: hypothetical protein JW769_01270 [Parachlamydiales bacterium]|nr:hypothetical protein [Parachlamydiales bacterium]